MFTAGFALLIGGMVVAVGGFIFCAFSMGNFNTRRFAVGMAIMALGGLAATIGFYLGGYAVLTTLIPGL